MKMTITETIPNYKIFWVDENKKKHTIKTFYAKDCNEALEVLKQEKAKNIYGKELYFDDIHVLRIVEDNGKKLDFQATDDDEFGYKAYMEYKKQHTNIFKRIVVNVLFELSYWILQKPKDIWYMLRDFIYLIRHKEAYSNQWNLDQHILDSILLNVPSLIKNSYGMKFIDDAIIQLHGKDENFDLKKYHEQHCSGYPEDVEKLESEIQKAEYKKLLLYVKLYMYYASFGIIDKDDPEQLAFDKEWHHTLPIKEGRYDVFDYDKLNRLAKDAWNNIWDWMKKHGEKLND